MDDAQKAMIEKLSGCRFAPGSATKRFVGELFARTRIAPADELTPRQDWWLRRLNYEYRVQLRQPDMRKPDDYHTPPADKRTITAAELKVREANGEIIVCRAPVSADRARTAELERLKAWNEGKPR
jgi:hypothetical protein